MFRVEDILIFRELGMLRETYEETINFLMASSYVVLDIIASMKMSRVSTRNVIFKFLT